MRTGTAQGSLLSAGPAVPMEPRQEIMTEVEDLGNVLDGLAKEFGALVTTLTPICAPVMASNSTGGRPYAAVSAPLAERLQQMVQQAVSLREYVVETHSRVRL